ncbi:MAG TPA: quinone-dependent dihydroorotate dehydrogenase [Ferruginibacter sp.]|nr:quinone-dependent dihydroorotate dehydrogenase [Ferruginibacter sp.]
MYNILRSFLFFFDPEWVHYFSMNSLKLLCKLPFGKATIKNMFHPKGAKKYSLFNITFPNRIGLGAGFDKNARYLNELEALGFGFVEIGTVTPKPQAGNDKPRLFRLPKDKALINRMGFNNDGVEVVAERLRQWSIVNSQLSIKEPGDSGTHSPLTSHHSRLIIGGNIGKNKITPNEDAWQDYEICFKALHPYVDYFVVNVSSPNTPGLRELQEKEALRKILTNLQRLNNQFTLTNEKLETTNEKQETILQKPILLKIAPDLTSEQIDDVIDLAVEIKLDGLVVSNTTIDRTKLVTDKNMVEKIGAGGVSGLPVKARSTEIVQYISQKTNGQLPLIASGGIFTGQDAKEKIDAGASLIQVWTGFIYEGPGIVKNICRHL